MFQLSSYDPRDYCNWLIDDRASDPVEEKADINIPAINMSIKIEDVIQACDWLKKFGVSSGSGYGTDLNTILNWFESENIQVIRGLEEEEPEVVGSLMMTSVQGYCMASIWEEELEKTPRNTEPKTTPAIYLIFQMIMMDLDNV